MLPSLGRSSLQRNIHRNHKDFRSFFRSFRSKMSSSPPTKKGNTTTPALLVDSPCWGSPEACSLTALIQRVDPKQLILFASDDFVAINKPPDLRMDGPYPATLLKLLVYLYPTNFLRLKFGDSSARNVGLLQQIEQSIHLHGDAAALAQQEQANNSKTTNTDSQDVPPRPCHQLDYATSGVVLVARTSAAANLARTAWESRQGVSKVYSAVVHGPVKVNASWPVKTRQEMNDWLVEIEATYRRQRNKRRPETFQGFMPPHSLFQIYKNQQRRNQQQESQPKKRRKKKNAVELSNDEWERVWKSLTEFLANWKEEDTVRLLEMEWKTAKKEYPDILASLDQACTEYNQILRDRQQAAAVEKETNNGSVHDFPIVFQIQEELDGNTFYINAPLAQVSDDFAMRLPPGLSEQAQGTRIRMGGPDLDYKPSLTKCTVVSSHASDDSAGRYTKVRLEPRTGRRHQLRVHMAMLHYPIVNDLTYGPQSSRINSSSGNINSISSNVTGRVGRMCLHSYRLEIAVDGKQLDLKAPDPFRVDPGTNRIVMDEL